MQRTGCPNRVTGPQKVSYTQQSVPTTNAHGKIKPKQKRRRRPANGQNQEGTLGMTGKGLGVTREVMHNKETTKEALPNSLMGGKVDEIRKAVKWLKQRS